MCANTGFTVVRAAAVLIRFVLCKRLGCSACQTGSSRFQNYAPQTSRSTKAPGLLTPGLMSMAPSVFFLLPGSCPLRPLSAPCPLSFCLLGLRPLCPQPPVRPLPAPCQVLCFLGSCPMCPPAPCQPPPRFSVAWAHVHCAHVHCAPSRLSAPCQVFCLLGSCPLCPQPPVSPLPGLLSPGLVSTAPPAPCQPRIVLRPQPPASPLPAPCQIFCFLGSCPMWPPAPCQPPPRFSVAWAHVHCAPSPLSACQVFCLLGSCPLRLQPPVRPLPGLLSPGLMSATLSDPWGLSGFPSFPNLGKRPDFS